MKVESGLEHSRGIPEFPNQNLRQIGRWVPELRSDKQANKHTNGGYNFIDTRST